MVMGYFNNPAATAAAFDSDGFLRTGDEGSISSPIGGLITIHDRLKEMIKVKGIQVAPAELEDLLLGHSAVEDCAVIGVPDDYAGERPLGFVVLKPGLVAVGEGEQKIYEELMGYVREKKVRTKWLIGLRVVDVIPKSASGKILRRVLRDGYEKEAGRLKSKL
jgi:4-coumarate--CoA ligase